MAELDTDTERALRTASSNWRRSSRRARQAIVGLGAQLAELRGDGSPVMAERLREAERQLAELEGTKVMRYTAKARRAYSLLRGARG